jgi:hypothetical protein
MDYSEHLARLAVIDPALAGQLAAVTSLEKVLAWLPGAGVGLDRVDLVTQDEYSHDFLVPLPDGRFLVFGMT